jgi:type II secretory pathway pseudopilin PulG
VVSSPENRHAVTLVELLTVLGIVTLVALLVLPSVKTMLTDRKSTNAATMVRNFLEAARARAVGSQIPVAVVLERISSVPLDANDDGLIDGRDLVDGRLQSATSTDPLPAGALPDTNFLPYNSCIRMSMAEQPLPITEKMLNGTPTIFSSADRTLPTLPPGTPAGLSWAVLENVLSNSPLVTNYFVAGNEVSLGQSNIRHLIVLTLVPAPPTNGQAGFVNHWFGVVGRNVIASNLEQAIPATDLAVPTLGETRFTVFQKPKPINGPNIQLPKGMCIDLSLSGFSTFGNLAPRDNRMRFSSAWVTAAASVPSAETLRPIFIVFSPDGSLSRVYANGAGSSGSIPIELADDLFLHIGKLDQVVPPVFDTTTVQNLTDPSMYIVRLSSKSGGLSVAPATQDIPDAATVGSVLELTRQGTYGASLTGQ